MNYYIVRTDNNVEKYVNENVSAVGWSDINFQEYGTPEQVVSAVRYKYYPEGYRSPSLAGRKLGEVRRFVSIEKGDVVLVPCYKGFYIGIATGEYRYMEEECRNDLANQIVLDFIKRDGVAAVFAREGKTTALSSKLAVRGFTVLQIREGAIKREIDELISVGEDVDYRDRVAAEEEIKFCGFKTEIQNALQTYTKLALQAKGNGFEKLLTSVLSNAGFETQVLSKRIGGTGVADADILAVRRSKLGDEFSLVYYIQAKHFWGISDAGIDQIVAFKEKKMNEREADGVITIATEDVSFTTNGDQVRFALISSGEFTEECKQKAIENGIILIDGERLAEMLIDVIDDNPEVRYQLGFVKSYYHFEL